MIDPLPAADDLLSRLRHATAGAHRTLEDAVQIERCLADRERYLRLLSLFFGFYAPLEEKLNALSGWERPGLDFGARQKTSWLESDLRALGLNPAELPVCGQLPPADSLARGFGCLYVLEGATLGGRQISASMPGSAVPAGARRFFAGYGAETGRRWREFLAALAAQEHGSSQAEKAELVDTAVETFARMQQWIADSSVDP